MDKVMHNKHCTLNVPSLSHSIRRPIQVGRHCQLNPPPRPSLVAQWQLNEQTLNFVGYVYASSWVATSIKCPGLHCTKVTTITLVPQKIHVVSKTMLMDTTHYVYYSKNIYTIRHCEIVDTMLCGRMTIYQSPLVLKHWSMCINQIWNHSCSMMWKRK